MNYKTVEIKSKLVLPYQIINITSNTTHFSFSFHSFDEHQSDFSIKRGGVSGKFGLEFREKGIDARIICDITIGNVFTFFSMLKECMEKLDGSAELKDYSNEKTKIVVAFEKAGKCKLVGTVKNSTYVNANGSVHFELDCDQSYFTPALVSFNTFFDEMARIQGYYDFKY